MCTITKYKYACGHFGEDGRRNCRNHDAGACRITYKEGFRAGQCPDICLGTRCMYPNCPWVADGKKALYKHMAHEHDFKPWECPYYECAVWESYSNRKYFERGWQRPDYQTRDALRKHINETHGLFRFRGPPAPPSVASTTRPPRRGN